MRLANLGGRATVLHPAGGIDVHRASGGRFPSDPADLFGVWTEFARWHPPTDAVTALPDDAAYGPPSPRPTQVFGIGLNYKDHAAESGRDLPTMPATFTKFPTCITGDRAEVPLPSDKVDWEVELVVVIGGRAHHVKEADAWEHVAGLTVGQDLSERDIQFRAGAQFSLGKSFPGFGPIGPWLVTSDEVPDRDDLAIRCEVNGEEVQASRTSLLVFPVASLIEQLSAIVPLLPGDLIFTGTPSGVGVARQPPRFLAPGDVIISSIEAVGTLTTLAGR